MAKADDNTTLSGLSVKVSKHGSPRIAQLLRSTVFGTEGKLRYRQNEIADRIKSQANVQFIEILKSQRVLGTVGMANRRVVHSDDAMHTLYVRYLSIAQPFKSKKRRFYSHSKSKTKKTGRLRELVAAEITNHFEHPFTEADRQGTFYAYVESDNINSRNLCLSMGFTPARKVETLLFSRFNPSQKKSIQNINEYEQDEVKEHLKQFYGDYSFYFEDQVFQKGFYFVKREKGKIVGGIRANPVNWELVDYPGFEGWLMRDILPYLPLTNRLFEPDALKFLAFDYVWHSPGYEYLIPQMMSHCSSLFGIHLGMIWGDMHSDLIKKLKSGNQLGFVYSVIGSVYADLMVRPINMDLTVPEPEPDPEATSEVDEDLAKKSAENEELVEAEKDNDDAVPNDSDRDEVVESVTKEEELTTVENEDKNNAQPGEQNAEPVESSENLVSEDEGKDEEVNNELAETDYEENTNAEEASDDQELPVNEDLERWKKIMQKPVFVSALDMT